MGDPELLREPLALALLGSRIPARLAYSGLDGTPRVLPIWFLWNGESVVMGSRFDSPKVRALRRHPRVALTIDSEGPPYRVLQLRGTAVVEAVDGMLPEYAECARRYYGEANAGRWLARMGGFAARMARIAVRPDWARLLDVGALFPEMRPDDLPGGEAG